MTAEPSPVRAPRPPPDAAAVLYALPVAVMVVDRDRNIESVNAMAEQLLGAGAAYLTRHDLAALVPDDSPLIALVGQVCVHGNSVAEYGLTLAGPRIGARQVDVHVAPLNDECDHILISLQERSMAGRMDHQLSHRRAARSVAGMAAVLAHEIKNPLSGIRGAAQLLEQTATDPDVELTQLICDETDRIRKLVDRMEVFSDDRPLQRDHVNIHDVLGHVQKLAATGFARHVRFKDQYDPSLPPVFGNRDQLVQVFLNLVKNAAEAVPERGGEITLLTRYQHGVRIAVPGTGDRLQLPIVVTVQDNGPGIPEDLRGLVFEPFVTTKASGTGLGLSLVAKIIEDHGGAVEVGAQPGRTAISVYLPVPPAPKGDRGP
jgi:two-component system nitrogen regulation sensor histidine kinase GlnL